MLRTMELRQLEQRVSIKYELRPLSQEETGAYVMHRLAIAGGAAVSFSPQALRRIHRITGGIPRVINLVCDRALLAAFSAHTNRVTPAHVVHAAETLDLADARTSFKKWLKQRAAPFAAGLGFAALVSVGAAYAWQPRPPAPPVAQAPSVAPIETPASAPTVAAIEPSAPPAAVPHSTDAQVPKPIATTGGPSKSYSVLVASFRMASEADMLATELRDLGYQASVARAQGLTNGWWHQVTAGPFGDLGAARETESRLRQLPGYADAHLIRN